MDIALRHALVLLAACSPLPGGGGDDDTPTTPDAGADACASPADPFDPAVLAAGVAYLASDELGGRASNTPGDLAARAYIEQAFRCAGLVPAGGAGGYQQVFTAPDGTVAANVVGYLPGGDDVIVIGAHHDHLGTQGGQIYNGANDNASGTIALIALARAFAAARPAATIAFVAFGYEENDGPCAGSTYYATHAPAALAMNRVRYMVNVDMVGTYSHAGEVSVYGANAGTRGRAILDDASTELVLAHEGNPGTDDSDFQAFADRGIPYVYFETWDDACYHKPCDDAARIDTAGLSAIARLSRVLVSELAK